MRHGIHHDILWQERRLTSSSGRAVITISVDSSETGANHAFNESLHQLTIAVGEVAEQDEQLMRKFSNTIDDALPESSVSWTQHNNVEQTFQLMLKYWTNISLNLRFKAGLFNKLSYWYNLVLFAWNYWKNYVLCQAQTVVAWIMYQNSITK